MPILTTDRLEELKRTTSFYEVSDIVPEEWKSFFFEAISDNAPFSWGDNNRTLVTAETFSHHVQMVFETELKHYGISKKDWEKFVALLEWLSPTDYIDLEN